MNIIRTVYNGDEEVKALYKTCFPSDSASFTEFYLNSVLCGNKCYLLYSGGTLASMLFILQKRIRIFDKILNIPFIVACATNPCARGRGFIGKLIERLLLDEYEDKTPFVLLHPFNHSFYKRFGFETIDLALNIKLNEQPKTTKDYSLLARTFEQATAHLSAAQFRTAADFEAKDKELCVDNGGFAHFSDAHSKVGYVCFDDFGIGEAVFEPNFDFSGTKIKILGKKPNTQARIVNASAALEIFKTKQDFTLFDSILSQNNSSPLDNSSVININELIKALFNIQTTAFYDKF